MQENFSPYEHRKAGRQHNELIRAQEEAERKITFENKLKKAFEEIREIMKGENGDAVATRASELLSKHELSAIKLMNETALEKEADGACTGAELLAACIHIEHNKN